MICPAPPLPANASEPVVRWNSTAHCSMCHNDEVGRWQGMFQGGFERDAWVAWTLARMVFWIAMAGAMYYRGWFWAL